MGSPRGASSLLGRSLQPLIAALWLIFVFVSTAVALVWPLGIGDADLERWIPARDLRLALLWLLARIDLLWITLAAANVYLSLAGSDGLPTARRWGAAVFVTVISLAWISARTGWPLGPWQFGQIFGPKIGPVPLGLPLFWLAAIIGAREALLRFFPRASHIQISLGTGFLALLTDLSFEPIAAKARGLWFWRGSDPLAPPVFEAPLTSCLVWGLVAGLLAFAFREKDVVASVRQRPWRPAAVFAIFHGVFLVAHLGRWLRD